MRIELRLPEDSDSDPLTEYRWMYGAGKGVSAVDPLEFIEPGVRRYRFDIAGRGKVTISLRNIFPPSARHGPAVRARVVVEVDDRKGLSEQA
jgi:hypothetical protein